MELLAALVISIAVNILMFIPAFIFKTDKLTDISYGLSFILVAGMVMLFQGITFGKLLLFSMITLWGVRIGAYLLIRIWKIGKDARFDKMRNNFIKFGGFWLLQGFTVWAVLISSIQYMNLEITPTPILSYVGVLIFAIGLIIESLADYQKYTFINNPKNKGKWIETGVWKYSRHPNYAGEIMVWLGLYIYTIPAIGGFMYAVGLISPLYIALLIIFISGIPLLEKGADKRWGSDSKYQAYKKKTAILYPKIW